MWRPKLEILQTSMAGRGLCPTTTIPAGTVVAPFEGEIVDYAGNEARDRAKYGRDWGTGLQIGLDRYIYLTEPLVLINHSCDPNLGVAGKLLVSLREIPAGEELAFDYSTTMGRAEDFQMSCRCGTSLCRGIVRRFMDLPKSTQKHYLTLGIVQPFILIEEAEAKRSLDSLTPLSD